MWARNVMASWVVVGAGVLGTALSARGASVAIGPVVNPANGHTYYLLTADTWTNSQAAAQGLGGSLVTINDAAENTFVFGQFGTGRDLWIGFNDAAVEGTFTWVSGETPAFTNWRPGPIGAGGQPDNFSTAPVNGEDYVHIYGTQTAFGGFWNDAANDPSVYAGFSFANELTPIQGVVEVSTPLPSAVAGGVVLLGGCAARGRRRRVGAGR